ncbi:hypothetical protein QAD02_007926 [Eretmocerus hayati]|uniref:Uncharacterized protein n=1 Tax=Eretmocerus hayati TaxID=131215 RepID=A0ACC2N550_9HYME|nr:hypothetical protein QAD02_007926 [Eretmocerus hayati]
MELHVIGQQARQKSIVNPECEYASIDIDLNVFHDWKQGGFEIDASEAVIRSCIRDVSKPRSRVRREKKLLKILKSKCTSITIIFSSFHELDREDLGIDAIEVVSVLYMEEPCKTRLPVKRSRHDKHVFGIANPDIRAPPSTSNCLMMYLR